MGHAEQIQGAVGDGHLRVTYNDVHILIGNRAKQIKAEFDPDLMIAIGGGGFFPARVLRTFLKSPTRKANIPIQAIGLSLYEALPSSVEETIGTEVIRTQWLDFSTLGHAGGIGLLGKRILIVDEVDDSRKTLSYAVTELLKDIEKLTAELSPEEAATHPPTQIAVFVVHNKLIPKLGELPANVAYFSGEDIGPVWVEYPWESPDIQQHDQLAFGEPDREATAPKPVYFGEV
ncbi:hypothetical protein BDY24DRAFT_378680 [Mrakia frigida]|uniref:phosphoribosyltransferase n=1 Tax=Mrakia frigida TaxID=29902 RepID=UPI003FCBF09E